MVISGVILVVFVTSASVARRQKCKENGDEAMESLAGCIYRGVPGQGTERTDGRVHGSAIGAMGTWLKKRRPRITIEGIDADSITRYLEARATFRSKQRCMEHSARCEASATPGSSGPMED